MTCSSDIDELRARLVDYSWRAWSCLGVAGWPESGFPTCIDIDAMVLLTGRLGDLDARLRDESIDWCVTNIAFVSRSRIDHLRKDGISGTAWAGYAGTIQKATKQRWPGAAEPFDWRASSKSRLAQRHDGATLGLRCRALFGATARSEVLRILLVEDETRTLDAREISVEAAYTKRSISDALVSLASAGVVRATAVGNALQFRLTRRAELEALLAPLPIRRTSQRAFCRVMAAILESRDAIRSASDRLAKIESARLTRTISADVQCIDPRSNPLSSNTPSLDAWVAWAIDQCRLQCGVSEKPSKRKSTRISSSV